MHDHLNSWLPGPLTCRNATDHITEYLDNRLRWRTWFSLWLHLTTCADCRAYADQLRLLRQTLPLISIPAIPRGRRMRLRQKFLKSRVRSADADAL